jgi:glycosyltransferase involved in cell wall biosynthesis
MIISKPLISIAICTYNGEKHIEEQLQSLVKQDYNNLEIVIADDRSQDDTWNILTAYAAQYSYIRIIRNEHNLGYARNFEKAARLCAGEFIAFSDQDDIWERNKISMLVEKIGKHTLIYHNSSFIDADGNKVTAEFVNTAGVKTGAHTMSDQFNMYDGDSALPFMLANCVSGHAMMFRKELLNYVESFDPRFFHDWMLAYAAVNMGSIKYLPEILVKYRQHAHSITDPLKLRTAMQPHGRVTGINRIEINWEWMKFCAEYKYNKQPGVIGNAYNLMLGLTQGKKRWRSFLFLSRYLRQLFYICRPRKGFFSTANMARKISFER